MDTRCGRPAARGSARARTAVAGRTCRRRGAKADGRWERAYSTKAEPPADLLVAIRAEPRALAMYESLSSQNRFALTFRTLNMKTEAGRKKKIADFVTMLAKGQTIHPQGDAGSRRPRPAR